MKAITNFISAAFVLFGLAVCVLDILTKIL